MIDIDLDATTSVVVVRPSGHFEKSDFGQLAEVVDPQIEATGDLAGVIIDAPTFPGWDGLGALVSHIRFVRDHQKHVKKIAEHLGAHFVSAEIRHFPAGEVDAAQAWIAEGTS
jgi:hypothetical protein